MRGPAKTELLGYVRVAGFAVAGIASAIAITLAMWPAGPVLRNCEDLQGFLKREGISPYARKLDGDSYRFQFQRFVVGSGPARFGVTQVDIAERLEPQGRLMPLLVVLDSNNRCVYWSKVMPFSTNVRDSLFDFGDDGLLELAVVERGDEEDRLVLLQFCGNSLRVLFRIRFTSRVHGYRRGPATLDIHRASGGRGQLTICWREKNECIAIEGPSQGSWWSVVNQDIDLCLPEGNGG